jgi:hypothetical protein
VIGRALAAALLAAGCGVQNMHTTEGAPAALQLGGIDAGGAFRAVEEGAEVELVEGAQGGFHVWVKYRVTDAPIGSVQILRTARRAADGRLVLRLTGTAEVDSAAWETPQPVPMFMCPSPIGLSVIDQPITLEVDASDDAGHPIAGGTLTVVPRCPDLHRDFCNAICTG